MKLSLSIRAFFCAILLLALDTLNANATLKNWINTSGGNWFDPLSWSPNGVPQATDAVTITNNGTYSVLVSTGAVTCTVFTIGGASGKQTLLYGSTTAFTKLYVTNSVVQPNGILTVTNGGIYGALLVQPGGELRFDSATLQIYALSLTNQGTVTVSNGSISVGTTFITNSGLWQITGNGGFSFGGGLPTTFINSGIVRKLNDPGTSSFNIDLVNSGTVDVLTGTLTLAPVTTNFLAGSFTATAPGAMKFIGLETDAGGGASGTGTFQFNNGTFYLRTNTIPQIKFVGGDIYVTGTTTFQQAGAITNLTMDGANLRGTNRLAGTLTMNAGALMDTLFVQPTGLLSLASPLGTQLYSTILVNQGVVNWSGVGIGSGLTVGNGTVISNGGTFTITGDTANIIYGGVGTAAFINSGTLQKTAGTLTSGILGFPLTNTPSGIIRVSSGILQLPNNYTNLAGELTLGGGTLTASGMLGMTGGKLDGVGTIGTPAIFDGGVVAPGVLSGRIQFSSGLTLGTNVTLILDATGTVPGVTYDQLSVTGAVAVSNCTLQVLSLPSVPAGTTFVIITNTTANATTGAFNGLPENASLTISGQPFRIHYSGGSGNDVVLVRGSGSGSSGVGPLLSNGGYSNTVFRLSGAGSVATIYTVQGTTNFLQWTNLGFATGDVSGNFNFIDTNATQFSYRFYRTTN